MIGVLLQSPRVYSEWTRYVVPVIPVFQSYYEFINSYGVLQTRQ